MSARDELLGTLSNTICNASNYTKRARPYLLGSDMSPVLHKTADALIADGYTKHSKEDAAQGIRRVQVDDEAVERAAKALCAAEFPECTPAYAWDVQFEDGQRHYRKQVRAVIAELTCE